MCYQLTPKYRPMRIQETWFLYFQAPIKFNEEYVNQGITQTITPVMWHLAWALTTTQIIRSKTRLLLFLFFCVCVCVCVCVFLFLIL